MIFQIYKSEYRFCHGREPRGKGYWAFAENGATPFEKIFWFNGLFSEASKEAIRYAKENNWSRLEVRP